MYGARTGERVYRGMKDVLEKVLIVVVLMFVVVDWFEDADSSLTRYGHRRCTEMIAPRIASYAEKLIILQRGHYIDFRNEKAWTRAMSFNLRRSYI